MQGIDYVKTHFNDVFEIHLNYFKYKMISYVKASPWKWYAKNISRNGNRLVSYTHAEIIYEKLPELIRDKLTSKIEIGVNFARSDWGRLDILQYSYKVYGAFNSTTQAKLTAGSLM